MPNSPFLNPLVMVTLAWPQFIVNPNSHQHWSKKQPLKSIMREAAFLDARNSGYLLDSRKQYFARIVFCPPDRTHRDFDNLLASMKSSIDGMCKGFGIDDRQIKGALIGFGALEKGGAVYFTFYEYTDQISYLLNPQIGDTHEHASSPTTVSRHTNRPSNPGGRH